MGAYSNFKETASNHSISQNFDRGEGRSC